MRERTVGDPDLPHPRQLCRLRGYEALQLRRAAGRGLGTYACDLPYVTHLIGMARGVQIEHPLMLLMLRGTFSSGRGIGTKRSGDQ